MTGRVGRPTPPGSVDGFGFEVVAVRSALAPQLAPALLLTHLCGWQHPFERDRADVVELAALMAVHAQEGCQT